MDMNLSQIKALPDDPALLKRELADQVVENERLQQRLFLLQRQRYGTSSEKASALQGSFEFAKEGLPAENAPALQEDLPDPNAQKREKKKPGGRKPAPAHWPRKRVVHDVPEQERACTCCGEEMQRIGEEVSEEWEYIPRVPEVIEHVRPKYACARCQEGVKTAPVPLKPIEQARPGPGMLAWVIYCKYGLHLPMYRQETEWARLGVELSRAVLCSWAGEGAERLRCIWECMRADVLKSAKLHTDDTPVRVQEPGRGKTRTARFWVYLGDGPHAHAVFDYTPSRARDGPVNFLQEYHGYLQADAFAGYDAIYATKLVIEVACWAHARRKFVEVLAYDPRAQEVLDLIGQIYAVEDQARGRSGELRRGMRQLRTVPVLERIRARLDALALEALPKSGLGKAVAYTLSNWKALSRFVEDGILEPDNNLAENALRRVALGRKNWLFLGNDRAGERAAILFSLLATCQIHEVDPWLYLKDVLLRVNTHPARLIHELTPLHWKKLIRPLLQPAAPATTAEPAQV